MKTEDIRQVHLNLLLQLANFNEYFIILAKCLFYSHRFFKEQVSAEKKRVILTESKSTMYSGVFKLRLYKGDKDALTPQTAGKALIIFYASLPNRGSTPGGVGIDSPAC